ncbi:hypothetical protein HMN09_01250400 [Mycena chlorophos]|uniref:Beta-lactamase-related domain-containing protein n=1 Tax=Mycena chlorophos TaxID=658473 RepID=A0A8H6S3D2_MYCCL|nr:hypothetical protein HMN09_01250400 [Mycena chlorophos]
MLTSEQKAKIQSILNEAVGNKVIPALFFGVATRDALEIHLSGNKYFDDPFSDPIDENTIFWLCSQTKLIAAIAGHQLIEQGKIQLDTPVEEIIPELANPVVVTAHDENGRISATRPAVGKITFGQLFNHSSGLDYNLDGTTPSSGVPIAYSNTYTSPDVSEFFKILKGPLDGIPLRFDPGTSFTYGFSNDVLGFIVENVSGKTLEQYFKDHIFGPLGLNSATFYPTAEVKSRLLPLTYRNADGSLVRWPLPPPVDAEAELIKLHLGGVGLYATEKDYLTVLQHILQIQGGTAANPILSQTSVARLFEQTLTPAGAEAISALITTWSEGVGLPPNSAQWGYGFSVTTADAPGLRKKGTGSWGGWATTVYLIDPTTGIAVVAGTQLAPSGDPTFVKIFNQLQQVVYSK